MRALLTVSLSPVPWCIMLGQRRGWWSRTGERVERSCCLLIKLIIRSAEALSLTLTFIHLITPNILRERRLSYNTELNKIKFSRNGQTKFLLLYAVLYTLASVFLPWMRKRRVWQERRRLQTRGEAEETSPPALPVTPLFQYSNIVHKTSLQYRCT